MLDDGTPIIDREVGFCEQLSQRLVRRQERDRCSRPRVGIAQEIDQHSLRAADLAGRDDVDHAHAGTSTCARSDANRDSRRNQNTIATAA